MDKWVSVEFVHVVNHRGWPISLTIEARYYHGTTSSMGDDPNQVEIIAATDGTDSDVWDKLPYNSRKDIEQIAHEKGMAKCFI